MTGNHCVVYQKLSIFSWLKENNIVFLISKTNIKYSMIFFYISITNFAAPNIHDYNFWKICLNTSSIDNTKAMQMTSLTRDFLEGCKIFDSESFPLPQGKRMLFSLCVQQINLTSET